MLPVCSSTYRGSAKDNLITFIDFLSFSFFN